MRTAWRCLSNRTAEGKLCYNQVNLATPSREKIRMHYLTRKCVGLLTAVLLLVPGVAAEDEPPESADALARYFHDDFSLGTLYDRGWRGSGGIAITELPSDNDDAEPCVRLTPGGAKESGHAELYGPTINLFGEPGADLTFTLQHRGVEIGKSLIVEYFAVNGSWKQLARIQSDGLDDDSYRRVTHLLPVEALHADFQARFRVASDNPDDAWYIGEAAIRAYEPLRTLSVSLDPPRQAWTEIVLAGRLDRMALSAPFSKNLPYGAHVFVIAPPTVDENVFSHWTVGAGRDVPGRVLLLEMNDQLEATAHYRPWTEDRTAASVVIVSRPLAGVELKLGVEPGELFTKVSAEIEYAGLAGERLLLLAPERTERMAFQGWVVNGDSLPNGDNLLVHQIADNDTLVAEYVLLGDVNGDDSLDKHDVELFIAATIDPQGYAQTYPHLDREPRCDINGDGFCDALDLEAFVNLLTKE